MIKIKGDIYDPRATLSIYTDVDALFMWHTKHTHENAYQLWRVVIMNIIRNFRGREFRALLRRRTGLPEYSSQGTECKARVISS